MACIPGALRKERCRQLTEDKGCMNIEVGNGRQKSWAETQAILRATESQWHFKRVSQRKLEVFGFLFPLVAGLDKQSRCVPRTTG